MDKPPIAERTCSILDHKRIEGKDDGMYEWVPDFLEC